MNHGKVSAPEGQTKKLAEAYDQLNKIGHELEGKVNTLWDLYNFVAGERRPPQEEELTVQDPEEVGVLEVHRRRVADVASITVNLSEIIAKLVQEFK